MKEFVLTGLVTISVYTRVEAETLDEAIEIAMERPIEKSNLGEHNQDEYAWINDEYDGEVYEIEEGG